MPVRTTRGTGASRPGLSRPGPAAGRLPCAFLDLGAVVTAPGCARAWTREILWEWGVLELADDAELVASELVTNAVSACAGGDRAVIRLVLTLDQGELAVMVRDDHPGAPAAWQSDADDEGGRGLLIVEYLSERGGWYPLEGARPAKVTWSVIAGPKRSGGEPHEGQHLGRLPDAGTAVVTRPAPALPARPRQAPPLTTGMRASRLVDLVILARVRVALERL